MSETAIREEFDQHKEFGLVPPESAVLNLEAEEISVEDIASPEIQSLIDGMYRIAEDNKNMMVGLAAPQVGESKQIVLIAINKFIPGEPPNIQLQEFINPVIIDESEETVEMFESCYSTDCICGMVERAKSITLRAYNRYGEVFEHVFEGPPEAHFAKHEYDHIKGIRFPERIIDDSKLHWVNINDEEEMKRYKETMANQGYWPPFPRQKYRDLQAGVPLATFA